MQVDPIKPKLNPPGTKRLKLKCDVLLSTFAFKFNSRRYTPDDFIDALGMLLAGRVVETTFFGSQGVSVQTKAGSCQTSYSSVLYFKSNDQNPTVNPPCRPPEGARRKRPRDPSLPATSSTRILNPFLLT